MHCTPRCVKKSSNIVRIAMVDSFNNTELLQLWEDKELCDVVVRACDGYEIRAHRIILAASSAYFRSLFVGAGRHMLESYNGGSRGMDLPVVRLEQIAGATLQFILDFCYTKKSELTKETVREIFLVADYLGISRLHDYCCEFLQASLQSEGVCSLALCLAYKTNATTLYQKALEVAAVQFPVLIHQEREEFNEIPLEVLRELLGKDDLEVPFEEMVLEAILRWALADASTRAAGLPELLNCVRFSRAAVLKAAGYFLANQSLLLGVVAAWAQDPPEPAPSSKKVRYSTPPPRHTAHTRLMAAGGHESGWRALKSVNMYSPTTDSWEAGEPLPLSLPFASCASVPGGPVVIGGMAMYCPVLQYRRDRSTGSSRWEGLGPLGTSRLHTATAALDSDIYVMGGRAGGGIANTYLKVEKLSTNSAESKWQEVAGMNFPRTALGGAALGNKLYVAGGQYDKRIYRTAEMYEPERDAWVVLPGEMVSERKYFSLASMGGRLWAVGGMTSERCQLATVETYDPREGRWQVGPSMACARSSCGVAVLHDVLYCVAGSAGSDQCHSAVEALAAAAPSWRSCAPLPRSCSGLAVCPI
eukprot:jgi/Botrbrau1/15134/Bobra.0149s0006.1